MDAGAIDGLLQRAVSNGAAPGFVAVIGDRDGTLYEGAFGVLEVGEDVAVRPDTMFWLASMTKAIASVAALQLLEQGRLQLDQPVADIVPAFGALPVLEGFDGDTPRLRAPTTQATIRHLLTHTSGASYWFSNTDVLRYLRAQRDPDPFAGKLAGLLEVPLVADPGTRWEYGTERRLAGTGGRRGLRPGPRGVLRRAHLRPAGHDRRDVHADRRAVVAHDAGARAHGGRRPRAGPVDLPPTASSSPPAAGRSAPAATTCASCARCCAAASSTASASCGPRPSTWRSPTTSMAHRCPSSCARRSPS